MITQPRGGVGVSKELEIVGFTRLGNGWTVKGKVTKRNGVMEISELHIKRDSKSNKGSITSKFLKELNIKEILEIGQKSFIENESFRKFNALTGDIRKFYLEMNYEKSMIKYLKTSWIRRGNQSQPDLVYAKLSVAYILSSLIYKNRGMTTLAEKLNIPKRTLISRINSCYDFGFLEKGLDGHFFSIGKEDVRWSEKTTATLGKTIDPIEKVLAKMFEVGEKTKKRRNQNEYSLPKNR
jgi:hypothetical protein